MIVTRGSVVEEKAVPSISRRHLSRIREMEALAAAAVALAFGMCLVFAAKSARFDEIRRDIAVGRLLPLDGSVSPERLADLLARESGDRIAAEYAAERIRGQLLLRGMLSHVGALHRIVLSRAEIERHPELGLYRHRWDEAVARADRTNRPPPAAIPLLDEQEIRHLKPALLARLPEDFSAAWRSALVWFFAPFFAVSVLWAIRGFRGDQRILPAVFLLSGCGLIAMISIPDPLRDTLKMSGFAVGSAGGCAVLFLCSLLQYERLRASWVWHPLPCALLLSLALVLFGRGPEGSGVRIGIGGVQPSNAIRLLVICFLASHFARCWRYLRSLAVNRTSRFRIPRSSDLLPMIGGVGLALALFAVQRDIGPAVLLFLAWAALYLVARRHWLLVAGAAGLLALGFWAGMHWFPHRLSTAVARWELYLNTWDNRISDQTAQAAWAYSTPGARGSGLGLGFPALVPEATTDMVLPALAEETGTGGFLVIAAMYALLVWRGTRAARRAESDYLFFLGLGISVSLAAEALLIAGGGLGIVPLSGVATPFLSYGKSAQLVYFACAGVLCAVSARPAGEPRDLPFRLPVRVISGVMVAAAAVAIAVGVSYQTVRADELAVRNVTVHTAQYGVLMVVNPRLEALARGMRRGAIYDRNGLPVATSDWAEAQAHAAQYGRLGIDLAKSCGSADARCYPAGPVTVHLLGDLRRPTLLQSDRQIERRFSDRLRGFHDYDELLPLARHRYNPARPDVRAIIERDRSLRLTLDLPLQMRVAAALEKQAQGRSGAAVVVDSSTGEVLAAYSTPCPRTPVRGEPFTAPSDTELVDRARAGLFPPGSIFKIVVAEMGLRRDPSLIARRYSCVRLPGESRVGNSVPGYGRRPVRDDIQDRRPHGSIDLSEALVVSCNAYFAQFGALDVGATTLLEAEKLLGVRIAPPAGEAALRHSLPWSSFGQGEVQTGLFPIARALSIVANGGMLAATRWTANERENAPVRVLEPEPAAALERALRSVVVRGTARRLSRLPIALAGKTGTAEVPGEPSTSWFGGFNVTTGRRLVMVAVIERGGYGGGVAASTVGDIAGAVLDLGLVGR